MYRLISMLTIPLMLSATPPDSSTQKPTFLYDLGITIEPARESTPLQGTGVAYPNLVPIQNQIDSLSLAFSLYRQQMQQLITTLLRSNDSLQTEIQVLKNHVFTSPYASLATPPILYKRTEGEFYFQKGKNAYYAKNYQIAIEYFQKATASDLPRATIGDAYYWIGDCYLQLHDDYLAIEYFKKVVEYPLSEKVADALYLTGITYRKLGEDHLAATFFDRITKRFPGTKFAKLAQLELKRIKMPNEN